MSELEVESTPDTDRDAQLSRLVELGVHHLAGHALEAFTALGRSVELGPDGVLVVHPSLVAASHLAPLLSRAGKSGFVVEDMTDLDEFRTVPGLKVPDAPLYTIGPVDRGDDLRNWSPDEAIVEMTARGRRPLTVSEGISWLLQQPDQLEPNFCFMTIASRKPKPGGMDARTPAIWISNGSGRDGAERRGAPKVGWCWAGNRHTWLGFASTAS